MTIDIPDGETIGLYCVCDQEMCWCDNMVVAPLIPSPGPPDIACAECAAGHHVWAPGGPRTWLT